MLYVKLFCCPPRAPFFYWNSFKLTSNTAAVMSKRRKSWVDPLFEWSTKSQRTVLSPVLGTGYHMQRMAKHVHKFQMYGEMYRGKVCWVTAHFSAHFFKSAHFTLFISGLPRSHSTAKWRATAVLQLYSNSRLATTGIFEYIGPVYSNTLDPSYLVASKCRSSLAIHSAIRIYCILHKQSYTEQEIASACWPWSWSWSKILK